MDGNFTLEGVKNGDIIQISFIGYATQEIKYTGQASVQVKLVEDTQKLDEVVVTALGIKREKKALGYSVSSVKGEELLEAGTPMNAMQALYGKTSGLQLQSTAAGPSGGMNIKVRNAISLTQESSTRPLIVVDGIPIHDANTGQSDNSRTGSDHGTGLNDINPEDIASIEILKGAKAAVLYGSEGANGVMLITTKSGSKKGLGIDFGVNHSWNVAAYLPKMQNIYGAGSSPGNAGVKEVDKDGFWTMTDPNRRGEVSTLRELLRGGQRVIRIDRVGVRRRRRFAVVDDCVRVRGIVSVVRAGQVGILEVLLELTQVGLDGLGTDGHAVLGLLQQILNGIAGAGHVVLQRFELVGKVTAGGAGVIAGAVDQRLQRAHLVGKFVFVVRKGHSL